MVVLDDYLWNDHSTLLRVLMPEEIEPFDDVIEYWYEIRREVDLFREKGAHVIEAAGHAWLGIPRNRDLLEYLTKLLN
jgi:hypothetical protein